MGLKLCESTQTHYRRSHTAIIGCYRSPLRSSTTASIHLKATVSNISSHAPSCRATIGASKTINYSVEWLEAHLRWRRRHRGRANVGCEAERLVDLPFEDFISVKARELYDNDLRG